MSTPKDEPVKSRLFTALRQGVVVRVGTFTNLELLKRDLPAPEYELVLDEHRPFPVKQADYREMRRLAYPSQAELADAMYWEAKGDSTKMLAYVAACEAVKARYPKE